MIYLMDNGTGGRGDVFKLWIDGVAQTSDGGITKGDPKVQAQ